MIVEGIGRKIPTPVRIVLSNGTYRLLRDKAQERRRYRGYDFGRDRWKRGFTKDPIYVGLVGEAGSFQYLEKHDFLVEWNLRLLPSGDGGKDLIVNDQILQIRTRRHNLAKSGLVRRGDDHHRIVPLACDIFVFVQFDETSGDHPLLLGWRFASDITIGASFERSPILSAKHWNLKIADETLLPMPRLLEELRTRA